MEANAIRKLHSLIDKVYRIDTLRKAYRLSARWASASGVDNISWYRYRQRLDRNLIALSERIRDESYIPAPYKVVTRKDANGKLRNFYIPSVEDRIVQRAIRLSIEPFYERIFSDLSFEYRPGRDRQMALLRIEHVLARGLCWVVDADVKDFFPSVDRAILDRCLAKYIADGKFLRLVQRCLGKCNEGLPVGNGLSPFLSNVYLHEIDVQLLALGASHLRSCDTILLFEENLDQAEKALKLVQELLRHLSLNLNEAKTRICHKPDPNTLFRG